MITLQRPPETYDQRDQAALRDAVSEADRENRKRREDVDLSNGERLILKSPNGARWTITVSNAGALVVTAL